MRKRLVALALLLGGLLTLAANSQTIRIGAGGRQRVTAAGDLRSIPSAAVEKVIVIPGSGIYVDSGEIVVVPGSGIYAGS